MNTVRDVSGRELSKGDTVTTLSGGMTGRVCDMAVELGEPFVLLRPPHQPYGPGVWHPADQVNRVAQGRERANARSSSSRSGVKVPARGQPVAQRSRKASSPASK